MKIVKLIVFFLHFSLLYSAEKEISFFKESVTLDGKKITSKTFKELKGQTFKIKWDKGLTIKDFRGFLDKSTRLVLHKGASKSYFLSIDDGSFSKKYVKPFIHFFVDKNTYRYFNRVKDEDDLLAYVSVTNGVYEKRALFSVSAANDKVLFSRAIHVLDLLDTYSLEITSPK